MRRLLTLGFGIFAAVSLAPQVLGYAFQPALDWPATAPVSMQLQLGSSGTLIDGSTSWNQVLQTALVDWNQYLPSAMQFVGTMDSNAQVAGNNGINNVFWSTTVFGESWSTAGGDAGAITVYWSNGYQRTEADIIFNSNLSWNSYRGALRHDNSGGVIHDIKRTALHELGHALGLDHPDAAGQVVTAIMNSVESSTDDLTADDIAGIRALYGTPSVPTVTVPPASQTASLGGTAVFTVSALGSAPLSYQWLLNGVSLGSGATGPNLSVSNVQQSAAGSYTVVVTGPGGNVTSAAAILTVTAAPIITGQPQSVTVSVGQTAAFTVVAQGTPSYQWYFNGTAISGQTGSTLSLSNVTAASAGSYTVVATNSHGAATSSAAVLSISAAPSFIVQPSSQSVVSGTTVVLSAAAGGSPAPTLQWKLNGVAVFGGTGARLVISGATASNAGTYTCTATNASGTAASSAATLSIVSTTTPGRLVNLSVNTVIDSSGLTMGFVTGGAGTTGPQPLLIRAGGPALVPYGVTGVLPDPQLTVYNGSASIASDAGWGTPASNLQVVNQAQANTGAGLVYSNPSSLDSATVLSLVSSPGYTVQVAGKSGDSGRTLAEVYDNTPAGTYTPATQRLINLSCRITVPANGSLTEGFILGGTTSKTFLIRAIGPGLSQYGISGVMADPQLTVYSGSTAIASNTGWGGDAQLAGVMGSVGSQPNPPAAADSIILITLAPGSYTAVATSAGGTVGNVLLDIYEVP